MGLFSNIFKGKNSSSTGVPTNPGPIQAPLNTYKAPENQPSVGILNLKKNDILNLSKASPNLHKIRVAAGWDVNCSYGSDYDLDLCAFLLDRNGKPVKTTQNMVFYGKKNATGIFLDGDNLTGEGDGDDENIYVTLNELHPNVERIVFNVVIYQAKSRSQYFGKVKNAYVRIVDESNNGREMCRYSLSNDGGRNTAVVFAELYKENGSWNFRAIGEYTNGSIQDLFNNY